MPQTPLDYESRSDTKSRWRQSLWLRLEPPARSFGIIAWVGIIAMFWGSALLPGGSLVLLAGAVLAPVSVAPIIVWEIAARPMLRWQGIDAPRVPRRWWCAGAFAIASVGFVTGLTARLTSVVTRPLWVPSAEYWYAQRPATAPRPRVLVLGPYVLLNPQITPLGIRGDVIGGGQIKITWSDRKGYEFKSDPSHVH